MQLLDIAKEKVSLLHPWEHHTLLAIAVVHRLFRLVGILMLFSLGSCAFT